MPMTEEQEKTIKRCEELIKPENANWIGISNQEAIRKLLNMLKEKENEIEKKDRQIKEKTNRIRKLEKEAQGYFETTIIQSKQFSKKLDIEDKKIDLMAETIRKLAISLANYRGSYNEETFNFTGNIKDIEQYFENKAEKE